MDVEKVLGVAVVHFKGLSVVSDSSSRISTQRHRSQNLKVRQTKSTTGLFVHIVVIGWKFKSLSYF